MAWSGLGEKEKSGLTWRLGTDLNLVSHEKKLMSLADFIHKCCVVNGVASIELLDHTLIQKEYPVPCWLKRSFCFIASSYYSECGHGLGFSWHDAMQFLPGYRRGPFEGSISVWSVPGRVWSLQLFPSQPAVGWPSAQVRDSIVLQSTLVKAFLFQQPMNSRSHNDLRQGNFGASYHGHYDKLPRTKVVNLVWELSLQTGATCKVSASKPKLVLTATIRLPPMSWVKLSWFTVAWNREPRDNGQKVVTI